MEKSCSNCVWSNRRGHKAVETCEICDGVSAESNYPYVMWEGEEDLATEER